MSCGFVAALLIDNNVLLGLSLLPLKWEQMFLTRNFGRCRLLNKVTNIYKITGERSWVLPLFTCTRLFVFWLLHSLFSLSKCWCFSAALYLLLQHLSEGTSAFCQQPIKHSGFGILIHHTMYTCTQWMWKVLGSESMALISYLNQDELTQEIQENEGVNSSKTSGGSKFYRILTPDLKMKIFWFQTVLHFLIQHDIALCLSVYSFVTNFLKPLLSYAVKCIDLNGKYVWWCSAAWLGRLNLLTAFTIGLGFLAALFLHFVLCEIW